FNVPGNHLGQRSQGLRWPYGPAVLITTFNFPLEIPVLQLMGALYMGNKVTFKADQRTAIVMHQFLLMMQLTEVPELGFQAPMADIDFICCEGPVMGKFVEISKPRVIQFTGSSKVAEHLSALTRGKVKIEDAGFDWKILGPDVSEVDYVAWQCDQDAYAHTGQVGSKAGKRHRRRKCQGETDLSVEKSEMLCAERPLYARKLGQGEVCRQAGKTGGQAVRPNAFPGRPHNRAGPYRHDGALSRPRPGSSENPGGKSALRRQGARETFYSQGLRCSLTNRGLRAAARNPEAGEFWPLHHRDIRAFPDHHRHLTAAIVSNDLAFQQKCIGATVNGTTYVGIRARTTGAPQNHWYVQDACRLRATGRTGTFFRGGFFLCFSDLLALSIGRFGPCGDPRGGGIGTIEAIRLVWSCHREVIEDVGPVPKDWATPKAT
ncbi:MAG: hypothetical protein BJ554DRAFT_7864, partial [Olpidium bornovanus]